MLADSAGRGIIMRVIFYAAAAAPALDAYATTYNVGDGHPFSSIGAVPWESLLPGDEVRIHHRPTPYREKWVIGRSGTAAQPIRVIGVPSALGERPIIDGANATTRQALDYWSEVRGIIKVGGSSIPADGIPQYIEIAGLDIRGAHQPATFTDDSGGVQAYSQNASAIFVEKGEHIVIRDCVLQGCGNGLFIASSDDAVSRHILIESCHILGNGNVGSGFEHNAYTAAIDIVYQFNHFGPLLAGAGGNNLKDRSAGLVVRYNCIESGNRQLDLVDAEDSSVIEQDPSYRATFVYGNLLIEPDGAGNKQIVHYGGDSGNEPQYRKGVLYFHHNTVLSTRGTSTTLFRLSSNDEHCDARNNNFHVTHAGGGLSVLDSTGVIDLSHNFHKPGWIPASSGLQGAVNDDGTSIVGSDPGWWRTGNFDYRLAPGSICIDAAGPPHPATLPAHAATGVFIPSRQPALRCTVGSGTDVGAYEQALIGDIQFDQRIGLSDLSILLANFGSNCGVSGNCVADLNGDELTNLSDLSILLAGFGLGCP